MMAQLTALLRGAPDDLREWIENPSSRNLMVCLLTIILGFSCYGLTVGLWRDPLMGAYVAMKMPLLIFITLACNGFLNGMLGLLLGSGLGFRQSLLAQLLSFSVAGLIVGSLSPVLFFMSLNAPEPDADNAKVAYANYMVIHTALIAYAGVIANVHLARLLVASTPSKKIAGMTLGAWLAGNAFVGAQFSWIFRPFFGSPTLEIEFLRDDAMRGTFYEAIWSSMKVMTGGHPFEGMMLALIGIFLLLIPLLKFFTEPNSKKP